MNDLFKIDDNLVFPNKEIESEDKEWEDRKTVKIILVDEEGKIALIQNKVHHYLSLPGGGVDDGESLEVAVKRECIEETGFDCSEITFLVESREERKRNKKRYQSFCYTAKKEEKIEEDLRTENEKELDIQIVWLPIEDILKKFEDQKKEVEEGKVEYYNTAFNILRDGYYLEIYSKKN